LAAQGSSPHPTVLPQYSSPRCKPAPGQCVMQACMPALQSPPCHCCPTRPHAVSTRVQVTGHVKPGSGCVGFTPRVLHVATISVSSNTGWCCAVLCGVQVLGCTLGQCDLQAACRVRSKKCPLCFTQASTVSGTALAVGRRTQRAPREAAPLSHRLKPQCPGMQACQKGPTVWCSGAQSML
jgi:hypothetical protein